MISSNFLNRFKYVSKCVRFSRFCIEDHLRERSLLFQVQLEDIRNSEHQLRWQPEEDYSECQRCHSAFSVTWRKHHCRK